MTELLAHIGTFIESPPRGAVIAFCWSFSWLITYSIIQQFKRMLASAGRQLSSLTIQVAAIYVAFGVPLLIMVGLYGFDYRPAIIHSLLIALSYQTIVSVGMSWVKKKNPEVYQAMRTNRRADDTTEFRIEEVK